MEAMVVDDSRAMRSMIAGILRELGFDVLQACDGCDALSKLQESRCPNLALVDWNMPNMNGPELLQALNNEGCEAVFGFVTTEATPAMRDKANQLGADFLISKPFTAQDFADALAEFT